MSRRARDWAWAQEVAPPQKLVLLALAERADDGGVCCPSLSELTDMTGLARSTVAVALNALEATRLIARERGGATRSACYRLLMASPGTGFEPPHEMLSRLRRALTGGAEGGPGGPANGRGSPGAGSVPSLRGASTPPARPTDLPPLNQPLRCR